MRNFSPIAKYIIAAFFSFLFCIRANYAQNFSVIQMASSSEVIALVDTILLANVEPEFKKNITFSGNPQAVGYFSNGYFLGFSQASGMVLSTGSATSIDQANTCTSQNASSNMGSGSDVDLDQLTSLSTHDACVIEFDIMLFNDSAFLSYIFASEEYHEYVNTIFNDVFGFFLSGPGISAPFTNNAMIVSLVSDTMPIAINSINCGKEPTPCFPPPGYGPNCQYLNDNTDASGSDFNRFVFDAFTDPFAV